MQHHNPYKPNTAMDCLYSCVDCWQEAVCPCNCARDCEAGATLCENIVRQLWYISLVHLLNSLFLLHLHGPYQDLPWDQASDVPHSDDVVLESMESENPSLRCGLCEGHEFWFLKCQVWVREGVILIDFAYPPKRQAFSRSSYCNPNSKS